MNNRKIVACVIGLTIFILFSRVHASSFIIELQNGREVTTSHVWEEGDEIKFYAPQGTAGFPKALVKRIKTSTLVRNVKTSRSDLSPNASDVRVSTTDRPSQTTSNRDTETLQAIGNSESAQAEKPAGDKSLTPGDAQSYRVKKQMLMSELDAATKKYLAASASKDPGAKKAALDDMRECSKKVIELGDELKKKSGGVLPDWWNE